MDVYKINGVLLQQACAALSNLALNNDHNQLKIAEAGGIEAVVAAMDVYKTSVFVQEHACAALWILAAQGSLRQRNKTAGGV